MEEREGERVKDRGRREGERERKKKCQILRVIWLEVAEIVLLFVTEGKETSREERLKIGKQGQGWGRVLFQARKRE